jgi:hypothetical protein
MEAFDYLMRLTSNLGHGRGDTESVRHAHATMTELNDDRRSPATTIAPVAWSVHAAPPAAGHDHRSFRLALSAFGL